MNRATAIAEGLCVACHRRARATKNHCRPCAQRMYARAAQPTTERALNRCSRCSTWGHNVRTCPDPVSP